MAMYIGMISDGKENTLYYAGYGEETTMTGTNRIPIFSEDVIEAKAIPTFIDLKRITGGIIDSIRYKDIKGEVNIISIYIV